MDVEERRVLLDKHYNIGKGNLYNLGSDHAAGRCQLATASTYY